MDGINKLEMALRRLIIRFYKKVLKTFSEPGFYLTPTLSLLTIGYTFLTRYDQKILK